MATKEYKKRRMLEFRKRNLEEMASQINRLRALERRRLEAVEILGEVPTELQWKIDSVRWTIGWCAQHDKTNQDVIKQL